MGDLNIEIASELNEHAFVSLDHDVLVYRDVRPTIGGTAANFALASLPYFRETHVIGKLGADDFGAIITRQLEGSGIHMHCSAIQSTPTGMAIYLRDANSSRPKGTRFLIVQPNAANQALTAADVEQQASVLANSDLFVLDGYCMLTQPRRDASLLAMQIAHSGSALVVFDIVPHTAYRMYGLDMLESITALADVIIVEVGAIRHFLGLSVPIGTLEIDIALATAEVLRSRYPQKAFLLRFGFGDCDQSLVCPPNNEPRHSFTGYKDATESRGFGDTLTARELAENAPLLRTTMNHRSGE
jgi:sugar/nucleoside kinase (ribokinase family)